MGEEVKYALYFPDIKSCITYCFQFLIINLLFLCAYDQTALFVLVLFREIAASTHD